MFSVSEAQQVDETGGGNAGVADAVAKHEHEQQKSEMLKAQLGGFGSSKSLNKSLGRSTGSRTHNGSRKGSSRDVRESKGKGSSRKKKGGSSRASSKRDLLDAAINS